MVGPRQGEIWWAEAETGRRPVLVVTRNRVLPTIEWITVAPITRRMRGIPTELPLGPEDGLREECVASFDNLHPLRRVFLTDYVGQIFLRRHEICRALAALADC